MATEHPNKILAHDPLKPYPKIFKIVFALLCLYLLVIFAATGADILISGGAH